MHCTLLIPGLFWPRDVAQLAVGDLDLPALAQLLARGRAERFGAISVEGWLCQAFEVERQQDWPIAPLTLTYDGLEAGEAYWVRADPVHVKVEREGLKLIESALFDLSVDEAQSLAAALDHHFAADGVSFHAPVPKRWYAALRHVPRVQTHTLREVAGGDIHPHLPAGKDALELHRVFNEAQMLLHSHSVNAEREERGEPPVNSVWLWGGGVLPALHGKPFGAVWSDDVAANALATVADAHTGPVPIGADDWLRGNGVSAKTDSHLILLDALERSVAYHDAESWRTQMNDLEKRWFAPLLAALRNGRLSALAVVAPGTAACCRFDVTRRDLLRLWRRPRALWDYA